MLQARILASRNKTYIHLRKSHARPKHKYGRRVWETPAFRTGEYLCPDKPGLSNASNSHAAPIAQKAYNKIQSKTTRSLCILDVKYAYPANRHVSYRKDSYCILIVHQFALRMNTQHKIMVTTLSFGNDTTKEDNFRLGLQIIIAVRGKWRFRIIKVFSDWLGTFQDLHFYIPKKLSVQIIVEKAFKLVKASVWKPAQ